MELSAFGRPSVGERRVRQIEIDSDNWNRVLCPAPSLSYSLNWPSGALLPHACLVCICLGTVACEPDLLRSLTCTVSSWVWVRDVCESGRRQLIGLYVNVGV